jgi:hypothetical protein
LRLEAPAAYGRVPRRRGFTTSIVYVVVTVDPAVSVTVSVAVYVPGRS